MKPKLFFIVGIAMAPVCVLCLVWPIEWILCPQALVTMFLCQAQHGYDSFGAPDYPDIAVAALYYPIVGWVLGRAVRYGRLPHVSARVGFLHVLAIGLAWAAGEARNKLWSIGFGLGG
jgi:hypothetical protein